MDNSEKNLKWYEISTLPQTITEYHKNVVMWSICKNFNDSISHILLAKYACMITLLIIELVNKKLFEIYKTQFYHLRIMLHV